uniref:Uncharacterized protein n=1 Tax=Cyprinodon variegatus TaxID=28743 RepID=A0A3Q2D833_CYPVA
MLITMLTAMYVMVKVQEEPLPYMVSQPLPWQVHSVSHSRRSSKAEEFDGYRRNSIGVYRKSSTSNGTCGTPLVPPLSPIEVEKAASTIQSHYRKFQQKKHKNDK